MTRFERIIIAPEHLADPQFPHRTWCASAANALSLDSLSGNYNMSIINNANRKRTDTAPLIERVLQSAQEPLSQDTLLARYRPDNLPANDNAWRKLKRTRAFGAIWGLCYRCSTERCYRLKQVVRPLAHRLLICTIDACREKALPVGMIANRCGGY